jgi:hypothetical protein
MDLQSGLGFKRNDPNGVNDITLTNVSVKRADGYGNYIGLTSASWAKENI